MADKIEDDFNPKKEFEKISANLEQPDKFAHIFCEAAKTQKSIDEILKENIRKVILHDKDVTERIQTLQREVNKEDWKNYLKHLFKPVGAILIFISGIIVTALVNKYIK